LPHLPVSGNSIVVENGISAFAFAKSSLAPPKR